MYGDWKYSWNLIMRKAIFEERILQNIIINVRDKANHTKHSDPLETLQINGHCLSRIKVKYIERIRYID